MPSSLRLVSQRRGDSTVSLGSSPHASSTLTFAKLVERIGPPWTEDEIAAFLDGWFASHHPNNSLRFTASWYPVAQNLKHTAWTVASHAQKFV